MNIAIPSATAALQPVAISPVEDIVADMKAGRIVILVDEEEDCENEGGDLVGRRPCRPEIINFMAPPRAGPDLLTLTREHSANA